MVGPTAGVRSRVKSEHRGPAVGPTSTVPGVTDDSRLHVALEAIEDAKGRLGPTYAALSFAIGRTAQLHIDAELVLRGTW